MNCTIVAPIFGIPGTQYIRETIATRKHSKCANHQQRSEKKLWI